MAGTVYSKRPLTIDEQIDLLRMRGVAIEDESFSRHVLATVSYYRFSAYLYPFRSKSNPDKYVPGTSFSRCWNYYRFDRRLRCILIDVIERVEVAVKTQIVSIFSQKYGAFGYRSETNFAKPLDSQRFSDLLNFVDSETAKSKEDFVQHFRESYNTDNGLPIWMAVEVMTFGNMLTLFRLLKKQDKQIIARKMGSNERVFESWLTTLNYIRNVCAHHGRIWNKHLAINPLIPSKDPAWHEAEYPVDPCRIYSVLCILKYLLKHIAPQSQWTARFLELLQSFPDVHWVSMAIPDHFEMSEIWR